MGAARKLNVVSITDKPTKVRVKLRAKNRAKLHMHQLPFVGRDHVAHEDGSFCFWDTPLTGGHFGGCETGRNLAYFYLSHLRHQQSDDATDNQMLNLSRIIIEMIKRVPGNEEELKSLTGQAVGFFSALDEWLVAAVRHFGGKIDEFDHAALLRDANAGLDTSSATARMNAALTKAGAL